MHRRPLLHDLLVGLSAPTQTWAAADGQVHGDGAQGVYHSDVRVLRVAHVCLAAEGRWLAPGAAARDAGWSDPECIGAVPERDAAVTRVIGLARDLRPPGHDPDLVVDRRRVTAPGRMTETITLRSDASQPVRLRLRLRLASDLATMEAVREGRAGRAGDRVATADGPQALRWTDPELEVQVGVEVPGATLDLAEPAAPVATWSLEVPARGNALISWSMVATDHRAVVEQAAVPAAWGRFVVPSGDPRLVAWLERALADLRGLVVRRVAAPDEVFVAAGAPWFLTLFGRDALITARMLLPLGPDLAAGTLRALAALQGRRVDPASGEQPGKIPHEVRRGEVELAAAGIRLPPVYYGTVDATPLWVCLLHDAWQAGMPQAEVAALLPNLEAALAWMADQGDADGDGFLEYVDESGHGLSNQGWKDSADSVRFRDGRIATGPIALVEVQGYAHEAATSGASLLDAFGRPGGDRWRDWAAALQDRFRASFWAEDDLGAYPGIALDGDKALADAVTSNMGHLLGTGILAPEEAALVARRLVHPTLSSGYGLRTMATTCGGYWPLSYHCGSVWAHDTGIAVTGLLKEGRGAEARALADGLLRAAVAFEGRMPELYAGDALEDAPRPVPYPTACRPQAWSAATALAVAATAGVAPVGA